MRRAMIVILICGVSIPALSQSPSSPANEKIAEKLGRPIYIGTSSTNAAQSSSPTGVAPPQQAPIKSTEVIGLADMKDKTEGTLTIEDSKLTFAHSGARSDIAAAAMEDVVTGDDSQRVIRGTLGKLTMFGPYGSGRVVSMWRSKIDSLTIQYRDANGGLHGVVFAMPAGTAESFKGELLAQGAHTSISSANASVDSSHAVAMEVKP